MGFQSILPPMSDTARDYQPVIAATTDGMDEFFGALDTLGQSSNSAQDSATQDTPKMVWTVAGAAKHFCVSEKTILRRLQRGTLIGEKVVGQFGMEWRIDAALNSADNNLNSAKDRTVLDICPVEDSPAQDVELVADRTPQDKQEAVDSPVLTRLLDEQKHEIAALRSQLEGAIYRNGYLESKLEDREQQIKLLTDSQHKGGWWAKFSSWFFKGK